MNDRPDPPDAHTEQLVRDALGARAARTSVSADAYDQVRTRADRGGRWIRPAVYAAAAAVVVLLVGVAILVRPDDDAGTTDSADATTTAPPPTSTAPTTTAVPTTSGATTPPPPSGGADVAAHRLTIPLDDDPVAVAAAGLQLFPTPEMSSVRTTPEDAARGWAQATLELEEPDLAPGAVVTGPSTAGGDIQTFDLHGPAEDGSRGPLVTTIVTATRDGGATWVVTHAVSPELGIDLVERNGDHGIRVSGSGTAYEGTALLRVESRDEPVILSVGSLGELDGFSAVVPDLDLDPVTITVQADSGLGIGAVTSFRARPAPLSTDIVVFGVAADDVLNVRSDPGVDNPVVATIPPEGTGIVHTGATAEVDGEIWWEIDRDDAQGWVNRRYLSVQPTVDATAGPALVEATMAALDGLRSSAIDGSAFAPRVEIGGIGVFADAPTPWRPIPRDELAAVTHGWDPFPDEPATCDDGCELTVAEFLGLDTARWDLADWRLGVDVDPDDPNWVWSTGLPRDFYERFTTVTVDIPTPDPQHTLDWRRYTVVWEWADGTPVIRGIWRWGWTP